MTPQTFVPKTDDKWEPANGISNWFGWDSESECFIYQQTEDYVFGNAGNKQGNAKRIGDMTRDELIHALSSFNHSRDHFAKIILQFMPTLEAARAIGREAAYNDARVALERSQKGGGIIT